MPQSQSLKASSLVAYRQHLNLSEAQLHYRTVEHRLDWPEVVDVILSGCSCYIVVFCWLFFLPEAQMLQTVDVANNPVILYFTRNICPTSRISTTKQPAFLLIYCFFTTDSIIARKPAAYNYGMVNVDLYSTIITKEGIRR